MLSQFQRTELLLGADNMEKLRRSRVAVFGVGGVGGYAVEALARSGVGALDLIDNDRVSLTNLNRQIIATHQTIGMLKTDAMKERLLSISPDLSVTCFPVFALPDNMETFPFSEYDYVVDAVDSVAAKVALAEQAVRKGVPIISSMGAGNKLDPTRFRVSDISKTSVCPLARAVRQALKKKGITRLKAVWSDEPPMTPAALPDGEPLPPGKRSLPGSIMFVPAAAGLLIAAEVIKDLTREDV
jgi:tRNA A37 threonylcarbamoyladenosine dehydratase